MDTVTQMLFGATVAQAGFRRRLGRPALAVGAALALVPDLDVAAGWIGGALGEWQHHRGVTHSLLFGPVVGPVFGWLAWRWHRRSARRTSMPPADGTAVAGSGDALRAWITLAILALVTHPVIDLFTSYGTQLLAPLATWRFAIDAMPIIDPVYSLALAAAVLVGALVRSRPSLAQDAAAAALLFVACYTLMGWGINGHVKQVAARELGRVARIDAYPLLFQPYYRRIVAETDGEVLIGFHSVLNPRPIEWHRFPRDPDPRIAAAAALPEARLFAWFAMDHLYWRVSEAVPGTVEALDIRYGLPQGPSILGFWGIRVSVDATGAAGPAEPFQTPRDGSADAFRRFWTEMVGG